MLSKYSEVQCPLCLSKEKLGIKGAVEVFFWWTDKGCVYVRRRLHCLHLYLQASSMLANHPYYTSFSPL